MGEDLVGLLDGVEGFREATPLAGLDDAWRWSPAPGIDFAGALSADKKRLLQMGARDSFDEELAVAVLGAARLREAEVFSRNRHLGAVGGFSSPGGYAFDTVAGASPEVHRFYANYQPEVTPHVRVFFPAYACEFSGTEGLPEAVTRYKMLRPTKLDRDPHPFLAMRYINTRTRGRSVGPERGFAELEVLFRNLRDMEGGYESVVEFENRHGIVWRVMWYDGWHLADWTTQAGEPQEISLVDLLAFSEAQLTQLTQLTQ